MFNKEVKEELYFYLKKSCGMKIPSSIPVRNSELHSNSKQAVTQNRFIVGFMHKFMANI